MAGWTEEKIIKALGRVYAIERGLDVIPNILMLLYYYKDKARAERDRKVYKGAEYEADLLVISKSRFLHEIEVKVSIQDFRADFKKKHYHDFPEVKRFSYCLPAELIAKHRAEIEEHCKEKGAGLIAITAEGLPVTCLQAKPRPGVEPLTIDGYIHYLRLAAKKWTK